MLQVDEQKIVPRGFGNTRDPGAARHPHRNAKHRFTGFETFFDGIDEACGFSDGHGLGFQIGGDEPEGARAVQRCQLKQSTR